MKSYAGVFVMSMCLLLNGCARHFVVERDAGRVDAARSITTNSDQQWTIQSEPDANDDLSR